MENNCYRTQKDSYMSFWKNETYNENFHHNSFPVILTNFLKRFFHDYSVYTFYTVQEGINEEKTRLHYEIEIYKKSTSESIKKKFHFSVPAITRRGTFIIDDVERIFLLQLVPSPGIFFSEKLEISEKFLKDLENKITSDSFKHIKSLNNTRISEEELSKILKDLTLDKNEIKKIVSYITRKISVIPEQGYWLKFNLSRNYPHGTVILKKNHTIPLPVFLKLTGIKESTLDKKNVKEIEKLTGSNDEKTWHEFFRKEFMEHVHIGRTGRWQLNRKLGLHIKENKLTDYDIEKIEKKLKEGNFNDDRDCLSNNIVLQTGDHLEKLLKTSLDRLEKSIIKKFPDKNAETIMSELQKKLPGIVETSVINLFKTSSLSQVIPCTNIISDVAYTRQITKLGPGGISKQTAEDYKTRDFHYSYYGRICPVDTPQSENIGLVLSLTENTRINGYGILEEPYYKVNQVKGKRVPDKTEKIWMTPEKEQEYYIAYGDQDIKGKKKILVRKGKEELLEEKHVDYIDCYPWQAYSLITGLIPFLSNNDPARMVISCALLRQALPLKNREVPLIYTGIEELIARESGQLRYKGDKGYYSGTGASNLKVLKGTEELKKDSEAEEGELTGAPPTTLEGEMATGVNLLVAYVPWKGYNFEDAIVISEEILKKELLTSLHCYNIEFSLTENTEITLENPDLTPEDREKLDTRGITKTGRNVKKGDLLISAIKNGKDASLRLQVQEHGTIINIEQKKKKIIITLSVEKPVRVGDKLANRYGSKGVISLILPEDKMPFFYDDKGNKRHIQVILNPLGVISRMNIGQIFETHLGLIAKENNTRYKIPPFNHLYINDRKLKTSAGLRDNYTILSQIKHDFEEFRKSGEYVDEHGKVILYDPMTGPLENPVVAGYQYIMKLNQLAEDKFHFRDKGNYACITEQPVKGKKYAGGQKIGEMEGWALQAYRAYKNLDELYTLKSDDIKARNDNGRGVSESLKMFIYYLRAMNFNIDFLDKNKKTITEELLFDEIETDKIKEIKLETASEETVCSWCNNREIKKVAQSNFYLKNQKEQADIKGTIYYKKFFGEWRKDVKIDRNLKNELLGEVLEKMDVTEKDIIKGITVLFQKKMEQLIKLLKRYFYDQTVDDFQTILEGEHDYIKALTYLRVDNKKLLRHRMAYITLPDGIKHPLTGSTIKKLPVIPLAYRPVMEIDREIISHDLNYHYEEILKYSDSTYNKASLYIAVHRLFRNKQEKVKIDNKEILIKPIRNKKGVSLNSFIKILEGKEGHIRKYMLGKRVDYSGRGVIVVDPELEIDQVRIASKELLRNLLEMKGTYSDLDLNNKEILEEIRKRPLILNRQPSLHRLSIQAFENVPLEANEEKVIYLNPLVTGGFGADFDGDTMAFHIPVSEEAVKETENLLPSNNILSPASEQIHFNLGQDIKLGNYFCKNDREFLKELSPYKTLEEFISKINNKDSLIKLKNVVNIILNKATMSGTTFSVFDLIVKDNKEILEGYKNKKIKENELDFFKENNTLVSIYLANVKKYRENLFQMCYEKGTVSGIREKKFKERDPEIKSCYLQGLTCGEYYYATYGARFALVSKKLGTGKGGDLTRHLIEAVYDITITKEDCRTKKGITLPLDKNLKGRYRAYDSKLLDENLIDSMTDKNIIIRSPVTCECNDGICGKCYGNFIGQIAEPGLPVGIIAAQSIGERGTQLQMKIIHQAGKEDIKTAIGQDLEVALNLFMAPSEKVEEILGKPVSIEGLMELAKSIYPQGSILDRHFEVIFRYMLKNCPEGRRRSLKDIINDSDFMKKSTFSSTLKSLAEKASGNNITDIKGYKKKLLVTSFIESKVK